MHIPDGYLSDPVCALTTAAATAAVAGAVLTARRTSRAPSVAATIAGAAGVMSVQMANFPVGQGTSGHLLGSMAAAVCLGPWHGLLTVAGVLALQAVLFGDGGLATLGANVLNMAVLPALAAGFALRAAASGTARDGLKIAVFGMIGAGSVLAAASACSLELAISGASGISTVMPAMLFAHLPMALAEGLATAGIALLVLRRTKEPAAPSCARFSIGKFARLMAGCVGGAMAAALAASSLPDGLERVAQALGLIGSTAFVPLAPDYAIVGIGNPLTAAVLAATVAALCASTYGWVLAKVARR